MSSLATHARSLTSDARSARSPFVVSIVMFVLPAVGSSDSLLHLVEYRCMRIPKPAFGFPVAGSLPSPPSNVRSRIEDGWAADLLRRKESAGTELVRDQRRVPNAGW